jgi:MFS transporter, DHA2 family, lincomycin resistance protein
MEKVMEIENSNIQTQNTNISMIMTILKIGTFLALLSETIINVALSNLMEVFSVSANSIQWLTMMLIGSAMGSSLFVGIMAYKQKLCLANSFTAIESLSSGINFSYIFVTILAIIGLAMSLYFRRKSI